MEGCGKNHYILFCRKETWKSIIQYRYKTLNLPYTYKGRPIVGHNDGHFKALCSD